MRLIPKIRIIIIERLLNASAEIPVALTTADRKSVKRVKLKINPITIPSGFLFDPKLPDKTIGRMGRMHGESMVIIPARNAKAISISIGYLILLSNSSICPPFHLVTSLPVESICTKVC